jgi:hypothetical protein
MLGARNGCPIGHSHRGECGLDHTLRGRSSWLVPVLDDDSGNFFVVDPSTGESTWL